MPDLFDFFKEQETKLHERPSEQVWKKLESRLEKRKRGRRKGIRFLQLGVIALIMLLLLLAAAALWHYVRQDGQGRVTPSGPGGTAPTGWVSQLAAPGHDAQKNIFHGN